MLAVALGALFLGIPHIQESAEAALAPKKQPPQDGPAGQDPGWLESPPHPPSPPPDPPSRPHGCDMQGVYCSKNETKAPDHGDGNGALKKLVKKVKEDEEGEEGEDEDWCDPAVQEAYFNEVDTDGGGTVDAQELTDFAEAHGMTADDAAAALGMMDTNGDGQVTLDEWKTAITMMAGCDEEAAHTTKLKAHDEGGALKKLAKKVKAKAKMARAHKKIASAGANKKKLKKKLKAHEKLAAAKARQHAAAAKKSDDGAVSFLQYEAATPAVLQPHEVSLLLKKLVSKLSDKEDEDPDEDEGEDEGEEPDYCDKAVQEDLFDQIDADSSGEISKEELTEAAREYGMCEEEAECEQMAEGVIAGADAGDKDGKISLEEFQDFLDMVEECNGKARTNLKAHTGGNGKKKLKKKLKAMEKKAEARRKQTTNQHAKKVIKKKIKASEKVSEAKERAHAAAARKAAKQQEDGDDDGKAM